MSCYEETFIFRKQLNSSRTYQLSCGTFFEETATLVIHVVGSIYIYVQVVVPIQCYNLRSNSPGDAYIT